MNREDFKDIIKKIMEEIQSQPETACIFSDCDDSPCEDIIMYYGIQPVE